MPLGEYTIRRKRRYPGSTQKTCNTLTWSITAWSVIILRYTGLAIKLSMNMPNLFKISPAKPISPNQTVCTSTSLTFPPTYI